MKSRSGFTLIEILVVVGLIMFLAAFVIVAAVRFGNTSREQATKALVQRIGMAINKYYGTYRSYPAEATAIISAKNTSIYEFLIPHTDNYKDGSGTWATRMSPLCMEFNPGEVRLFGTKYWAVDAWGNKILYFAETDMQAQVGNFRMVSSGPNGKLNDADDISLSKVNY